MRNRDKWHKFIFLSASFTCGVLDDVSFYGLQKEIEVNYSALLKPRSFKLTTVLCHHVRFSLKTLFPFRDNKQLTLQPFNIFHVTLKTMLLKPRIESSNAHVVHDM